VICDLYRLVCFPLSSMSVAVLPASPSSAGIDATLSQPALSPLPLARPPLIRKGTSYLSNASNGSNQSQGCRLLWRGKIITEQRIPLHGNSTTLSLSLSLSLYHSLRGLTRVCAWNRGGNHRSFILCTFKSFTSNSNFLLSIR